MERLVKQATLRPVRKVGVGVGVGGAIVVALVAVVNYYTPGLGDTLAPTISALVTWALTFVSAYMTKERG